MALRIRKSVKLLPGVRLNFSGGGVSTTIGVPGANINIGKRDAHLNVGVPGSGLSYRTRLLPASEPQQRSVSPFQPPRSEVTPPVQPHALPGEIRSADIGSLTSPGLGELKRLINEATIRRITLLKSVFERERQLLTTERKLKNAHRSIIRIFLRRKAVRLSETAHTDRLGLEEARANCGVSYQR
ncbi:MAG: hypothetical protein QOD74_971 [Variibacter sp.]|jgi:hypothetical protein|nr:hypothetical protein [Variibacter sp.]